MYDDTYSLSDGLKQNTRDNIYIQISEPTNDTKDLEKGRNIVYLLYKG